MPTVDQFSSVSETAWQKAATRLNQVGVFADEEDEFLPGQIIHSLLPGIEQKLRTEGYCGGQLDVIPLEAPLVAQDVATYLLYDTNRFSGPIAVQIGWLSDYQQRWHDKVTNQVKEWLERLAALRSTFEQWIQERPTEGLHIVDRHPVAMHDELMRRFGVPPAEMPVYEIVRGGTRLMRVQPRGLWVIGANGRVDLITKSASLILVGASDSEPNRSGWKIYEPQKRPDSIPLSKQAFLSLLQQAAA